MCRNTADIAKLLRELLRKHGKRFHQDQSPVEQLLGLSQAINWEWRNIHQKTDLPKVLFLRAEHNDPDAFEIFYFDRRDQHVSIRRSDLYEKP